MSDHDLDERLRRLGLRVDHEALTAFLSHVHKSRLGPTETLEQLADLEEPSDRVMSWPPPLPTHRMRDACR
jgi:hypothetical protein